MNKLQNMQTDVLVAGAGIAGIKAAYTAAKNGCSVIVISKSAEAASNFVLGFNAVLSPNDSNELYAEDTKKGGGLINNTELVKVLSENAAKEVKFVENTGLEFDKDKIGYNLLKPLGCTEPRLAHIKNLTGKITLERFLRMSEKIGVKIFHNTMLSDIITKNGKATGAAVLDLKNKIKFTISAKAVVIATGGIHIAADSTYPPVMTGDGYGAAYRAGAELIDMEFIQYEPCRCIYPKKLGISTTLLAKGGIITNCSGERFLLKYYENEGSIPKDTLARLIYEEIRKCSGTQHGGVYLDLTDVPEDEIKEKHSLYYNRFKSAGIDITKEKIEVAPCAHSFMGGIVIDKNCRTCVEGLFAAGEAAGGIHGANRIGGNAGTEIYVFGTIAGENASQYAKNSKSEIALSKDLPLDGKLESKEYFEDIKAQILALMSKYMGPVRNGDELKKALKLIKDLNDNIKKSAVIDFDALVSKRECENMLVVCFCSCRAAIERKESRGAHYRSDYPESDDAYRKNYIHKRGIYEL